MNLNTLSLWCTAYDNVCHGYATGLTPTKLTQEQVDYCRSVCVKGHREFGVRALARRFGVSSAAMCQAIGNQTWAPKPS